MHCVRGWVRRSPPPATVCASACLRRQTCATDSCLLLLLQVLMSVSGMCSCLWGLLIVLFLASPQLLPSLAPGRLCIRGLCLALSAHISAVDYICN